MRLPASAPLLLLPALFASCVIDLGGGTGRKAEKEVALAFAPTAAVTEVFVDTYNGSVRVEAGEGAGIEGTSKAWARGSSADGAAERLAGMEWTFAEETGGRVTLRMSDPASGGSNNAGASATLKVPAGVRVLVDTSNAPVEVIGEFPYAWVDTSNAPVRVEGARDVEVDTSNAPVTVVAEGSVTIDTSNAPVNYRGGSRAFRIDTSNAPVEVGLTGDWDGEGAVDTSNGPIAVTCAGTIQGAVQHRTSNGRFSLVGPEVGGERGKLELETSNGSITVRHGGN